MLALERGRGAGARAHARELHGCADDGNLAEPRMQDALDHLARRGLRIVHDLVHGVHRRRRDSRVLQQLQQRLAVEGPDRLGDRRLQLGAMPGSPEVGREALVA